MLNIGRQGTASTSSL